MPISKDKKKVIWQDVTENLSGKASIVFVNFHGLTVADSNKMRKQLKSVGVSYMVAKKSIVKKVLANHGATGDMPALTGELAIATSNDPLAAAREVYTFQKQFDGRLAILGGIYESAYQSKDQITALATIPPIDTLRGMFVNVINSPIQGLVIALDAIAKTKTA